MGRPPSPKFKSLALKQLPFVPTKDPGRLEVAVLLHAHAEKPTAQISDNLEMPHWSHWAADCVPIGLPRIVIPSGKGRAATLKPRSIRSLRMRRWSVKLSG